jgi:O-antigen/teichoic acid export membrane protein
VETIVLVPLVVAFGAIWGATGAAAAVLVATVVFVLFWSLLFLRIKKEPNLVVTPPTQAAEVVAP